jgi:hypothetical protein
VDRCEALTRFREPTRVLGNLRDRTFEEQVKKYTAIWNAPPPAVGVVAAIGSSVALPGTNGPGTAVSLPRDPAAPGSSCNPPRKASRRRRTRGPRHHRRSRSYCGIRLRRSRPRPGWEAPRRHPRSRRHCRGTGPPQSRPRNPERSLLRPRWGASRLCHRADRFRRALRRRRVRPHHLDMRRPVA